jgi:lipopolysaccharide export system protein LptA
MTMSAWLVYATAAWAQVAPNGSSLPSLPPLPETSRSMPKPPPPEPPPALAPLPEGPVRLRSQEKTEPRRGGFNLADSTVITSDDLAMDMERKIATFTGHVKVVDPQGTMTADKMIVYLAQEGENQNGVKRIEASGGVTIAQQGSKAMSDEAVYDAATQTVVLSGAASVDTADGTVMGETVTFNMATNSAQVKGRPRMIIRSQQQGSGTGSRPGLFPAVKPPLPASK